MNIFLTRPCLILTILAKMCKFLPWQGKSHLNSLQGWRDISQKISSPGVHWREKREKFSLPRSYRALPYLAKARQTDSHVKEIRALLPIVLI